LEIEFNSESRVEYFSAAEAGFTQSLSLHGFQVGRAGMELIPEYAVSPACRSMPAGHAWRESKPQAASSRVTPAKLTSRGLHVVPECAVESGEALPRATLVRALPDIFRSAATPVRDRRPCPRRR
jgi:hypothetical protein